MIANRMYSFLIIGYGSMGRRHAKNIRQIFHDSVFIDILRREETEEYKAYTKTVVPVGRSGVDGELDSTVVYLASPSSSYVTGQAIAVDGGYTCI